MLACKDNGVLLLRAPLPSPDARRPHIVQLFDSEESRARVVSAYLLEGFACGDALLVVTTAERWKRAARRLHEAGVSVRAAMDHGRLTLLDAAETLNGCTLNDWPVDERFDEVVGGIIRRLRQPGTSVRVYGEMVDLLAREGSLRAAQRLETLWSELAAREPFTLFCGYAAVHFGHPATAADLETICSRHTHVASNASDLLGHWLTERAIKKPETRHAEYTVQRATDA